MPSPTINAGAGSLCRCALLQGICPQLAYFEKYCIFKMKTDVMQLRLIVFLLFLPAAMLAQSRDAVQKLNAMVKHMNQSNKEVESTAGSIIQYYQQLNGHSSRSSIMPNYVCPVQREDYYYKKALAEVGSLTSSQSVMHAFRLAEVTAESINQECKALETYHRLQDYKQDNYQKGYAIVGRLMLLIIDFKAKQDQLYGQLRKLSQQIGPAHAYDKPVSSLRNALNYEREFIDRWKFNLNEQYYSGWDKDIVAKSILGTDELIKTLERSQSGLAYPASGMWQSFIDGLKSIAELKRNALDRFNHAAMQSDQHANRFYLDLINYYNGVLVSNFNTLIDYASNDTYTGLKEATYVVLLEQRNKLSVPDPTINPYQDATPFLPKIASKGRIITKEEHQALENYVLFINESFRRVSHQRDAMRNFSQSVSYFATSNKGTLRFEHDGYSIPLSFHQKAKVASSVLPREEANVLNTRADVILAILTEMDEIGVALRRETLEKSYERDRGERLYELIERTQKLYNDWDAKKEQLYNDVRTIFDSFARAGKPTSWGNSGAALWELTKMDRDALFMARTYYQGTSDVRPPTSGILEKIREVVANEFDNLKGIQKLGRSHGLCPYTPYEDLAISSGHLRESLDELKAPKPGQSSYQHPFHTMVYHYNDVVKHHNKFSELSPEPILKTVYQPDLFEIRYPETKDVRDNDSDLAPGSLTSDERGTKPHEVVETRIESTKSENVTGTGRKNVLQKRKRQDADDNKMTLEQDKTLVDRTDKPALNESAGLVRDTVYIERRDTVYIHDHDENLRSMEGYATNNLVLLLDVSGSMNSPEKLPLLKESVTALLSMMREEDEIAIVVFSGKPTVLLKPVSFRDAKQIHRAIDALQPSGKTDANAGLKLAYKVADGNYIRGGNNRIVLATDGEFVINEESRNLIRDFTGQDIYLSVFNFGKGAGSSRTLESIAQQGKGAYRAIERANIDINLIREVKAKRAR